MCALKFSFFRVCKIGAQIPFGENAFRAREAMSVENAANFPGEANRVVRIGGAVGVGVPGIKIERHLMRGAIIDESFAVAAVVGREGFAVTANFQRGICRFQSTCGFFVQRIELLQSTGPE